MLLTRRHFLASTTAAAVTGKRPNFVVLYTDDQRFDTIAALGNREIRTPNLDRLVRRGVTFANAFIPGGNSGAVCIASRAMLLTGKSLFRIPAPDRGTPFTTFPEQLGRAGYQTFATGKWHNGTALFNRAFAAGDNIFFGGMTEQAKAPVQTYDGSGAYPKSAIRVGNTFSSELFTSTAIRFLENRDRSKPYLLYTAFTSPHDPRTAPERFAAMYSPDRIALPKSFLPEHPFDNGELKVRDELLAAFPRTPDEIRRHIADYYAMVSEVDAQIGRVIDAVDASDEADNTYILFAGDNGLALGRHGLMGKQSLYEHSVHVPLIIAGPGVARNKRANGLCYLLDLCPTILDAAGIARPPEVEGLSLMRQLQRPGGRHREALLLAYRHLQRGVRTDRWKLIGYNIEGRQRWQLFDIRRDPDEIHDLSQKDPGRVQELKSLLAHLMKEAGDPSDLGARAWSI